mgnify:CR=1 FL=1
MRGGRAGGHDERGQNRVQTTLRNSATLRGTGLHGGADVRVTLAPAQPGTGIVLHRHDLPGSPAMPALWHSVDPIPLCTRLAAPDGTHLATVEHLMAALAGCGVTNARVLVTGPELPALDGSAKPFVEAIAAAGLRRQAAPLRALEVLRPVEVSDGTAGARLEPADRTIIGFEIRFPDRAIGHQALEADLSGDMFVRDFADARTFCRASDVAHMRAQGRALGGTLDNAVVVEGEEILTPGGLRHADEPVRHKILDALGDLALAGGPLFGRYTGRRAGHALTLRLLSALFATPGAVRWVTCDAAMAARLPHLPRGRDAIADVA